MNGMLKIKNSFELFDFLLSKNLDIFKRDKWWWPNSGSFEVIIGVVLTQNTNWNNVEKSLSNLRNENLLTLDNFISVDENYLKTLIKPSGFYNQKSNYLLTLSKNIKDDFKNFKNFKNNANRDWLLLQKGIGKESADSILNYCCYKEALVIDNYTKRLINSFGYNFTKYDDLQNWVANGIKNNYNKISIILNEYSLSRIYAIFHALIVEYSKIKLEMDNLKLNIEH